jgi:tetratricopeptide (TPR) repeat protein
MHHMKVIVVLLALGTAVPAKAQALQQDRLVEMQGMAAALGVKCDYCHAPGRDAAPPATAAGKPRQDVAREMMAMTRALNDTVVAATGKPAADAVRVQCVTCHRGVPIPRQLADIIWQTALQQGADGAVAQYRSLRAQFYGKQAYDFSEESLFTVAERLAQGRPAAAIALMEMNLELYPSSVRSYAILARAQARQQDGAGAITSLRKALEIDPENGALKGQLLQLERQYERR